jgi:hypothetical protein
LSPLSKFTQASLLQLISADASDLNFFGSVLTIMPDVDVSLLKFI